MTRSFAAAMLASVVALALGACGDDSSPDYAYAGPASGGGDPCNSYTTCGTCTPVEGCGWCFSGSSGLCASSPDECAGMDEFTWDWNPGGCPDVDASVAPLDAGVTPSSDASSPQEASTAAETGVQPEAGAASDAPAEGSTAP